MKKNFLLALGVLLTALVWTSVQFAASPAIQPKNSFNSSLIFRDISSYNMLGGCPYDESQVHAETIRGVRILYYWKCKFVYGDPEWHMYMKHTNQGRYQVYYDRVTESKYGRREQSTYVFVSSEYKMLDGGNTSTDEPDITITDVKSY